MNEMPDLSGPTMNVILAKAAWEGYKDGLTAGREALADDSYDAPGVATGWDEWLINSVGKEKVSLLLCCKPMDEVTKDEWEAALLAYNAAASKGYLAANNEGDQE